MSDEAALLRAIVESPDDLTLRLVFADWCEEHGRSERAALIRGQCFLDPLIPTPTLDDDGEGAPDPRYLLPSQLSVALRQEVLRPFRGMAEQSGLGWGEGGLPQAECRSFPVRRGFVEQFFLQGQMQLMDFLPHARAILERTPLLVLRLFRRWGGPGPDPDHLPAELVRQLVAVGGIERVRELDLSSHNVGEAGARVLVAGAPRLRLTSLRLRERKLSRHVREQLRERYGAALALSHWPVAREDDIPF